jgi:hypothetical protein
MPPDQWRLLLNGMVLQGEQGWTADRENLDAFEKRSGFKLPDSYRSFCTVCGPGELCGHFWIASPGYPGSSPDLRVHFDLSSVHDDLRKTCEAFSPEPGQWQHASFFARTPTTDYCFWDLKEVTNPDKNEYAIFIVDRSFQIRRAADNFWDFVVQVCMADSLSLYENPTSRTFRFAPL